MKKIILPLLSGIILAGCLVGPNYHRRKVAVQPSFVNANPLVTDRDSVLNLKWFKLFGDQVLIGLIDSALKNNLDLRSAIARVEQSRALYGFAKADLFPAIGYAGKAGTSNQSNLIGLGNQSGVSSYQALGNVSWELDVWGKIRRSNRAALNQMLASLEARKAIQSTIVSDVASLYFQLRDFDNRLIIARSTLQSRQEYYDRMKERFKGGDISELDLLQSEQQLREAQAAIPNFARQIAFTEHALNVVMGKHTVAIPRGLTNFDQPESPVIPSGLPSTLLNQRPDVRQAEYNLVAEVERIGAAQALRLPSFSLTGAAGIASTELSTLTSGDAFTTNLFGNILGPIFNFNKNIRRVEAQKKSAEAALYQYQKTYLVALADVENSLVANQTFRTELEARQQQLEATRKNLQLSRARYDEGYTSYLEVLIAETNYFNAALATSAVRAQQLTSTVTLYRSLGGGWE